MIMPAPSQPLIINKKILAILPKKPFPLSWLHSLPRLNHDKILARLNHNIIPYDNFLIIS